MKSGHAVFWLVNFWSKNKGMVLIMYNNLSVVRILELWCVGGGKRLTTCYFGIGLRHCADRVIFPVGGMSGCLGEFLSPSLGIDPLALLPQIFRSTGLLLLVSKMFVHRRHGLFEDTKGRPSLSLSRLRVIL